jgi:D-xylose transport system permease protein
VSQPKEERAFTPIPTTSPIVPSTNDASRHVRAGSTPPMNPHNTFANDMRPMLLRLLRFESLPLIAAMIAFWVWMDLATKGTYFGSFNISNILVESVQSGVVAIGVVVILLLGEIDLSLGSLVALSGCGSALVMQDWVPKLPDFERMLVGIAAALIIGAICGLWSGFWVAIMRVPSFVVTLAGLFIFEGIDLLITNSQTIAVTSPDFNALGSASTAWNNGKLQNIAGDPSNIFTHVSVGTVLAVVAGIGYYGFLELRRRDRIREGLDGRPRLSLAIQATGLTILGALLANKMDSVGGVPLPVVIFFALLLLFAYVLGRTRYGRHIYAAGGNAEAARRAGISVQRLRWSAFVISGTMAGVGGVISTARYNSISVGAIDSSFLLIVIASAVIGGVSLFGGKGSVWMALLGSVILVSVKYGVLLTLSGGSTSGFYYTYVATGGILLAAATIDAVGVGGRNSGVGLWASNMMSRLPGMRRN